MNYQELVAKQALEIDGLKEVIRGFQEKEKEIFKILYSIGAPLNDNKLGYSGNQLKPFFEISKILTL